MAALTRTPASVTPTIGDYDYIRFLTRSRVAWEYLRRNPDYRADWQTAKPGRPQPITMIDESVVLRARRRYVRAEAWGLCTFR